MSASIGATARCAYCDWGATMRGDTALEVGVFLRARLLDHIAKAHPGIDRPPVIDDATSASRQPK